MFEIVTPCPDCGSTRIGQQLMNATNALEERCFAFRKCCLCSWRGEIVWPQPNGLKWEAAAEPTYPVYWEEQAKRLAEAARGLIRRGYVEIGAPLPLKQALADFDQHLAEAGASSHPKSEESK